MRAPLTPCECHAVTQSCHLCASLAALLTEVWTVDSTAPTMLFIDWDAVRDEETLQVTLQLDERLARSFDECGVQVLH